MSQLVSVRSNQNFGVQYEKGKLIPQTEIIILIEKPKYIIKGDSIKRDMEVSELRFTCGTETLNHLIGQLQQAQRVASQYDQLAGSLNEIIVNSKPIEGSKDV